MNTQLRGLRDRAMVVTGAGRGLGEAFALHLAQAGAAVLVNDVDAELAERTAETIRGHGGRAIASGHTVTDPDQAREMVERCVAEFGAIDGLVNNAGLNYEALPWQEEPDRVRELTVRRAFDEVFGAHLEPYGLEKRVPPRLRKWTETPPTTPRRSA